MNLKVAGFVAGGAFVLSFLSAIVGGVPFFDVLLRATFWAIVSGAISVGLEVLLRKQLPELFQSVPPPEGASEDGPNRVDISLEAEGPTTGFVEELEEDQQEFSPEESSGSRTSELEGAAPAAPVTPASESVSAQNDEELPEIGSFLDSFRPQVAEGESDSQEAVYTPAASSGDDEPLSSGPSGSSSFSQGSVEFDGPQDPTVLAKAVQTVMKKGQ